MKIQYQWLSPDHLPQIYATFIASFANYQVPNNFTQTAFANNLKRRGVCYELSAGAFRNGEMLGFFICGFGTWNQKDTAYDIATGVLPESRGSNMSSSLFRFILPQLKKRGCEILLLEVIRSNHTAVRSRENQGFKVDRELLSFTLEHGLLQNHSPSPDHIVIKEMAQADWEAFGGLRDCTPSWQNSRESLQRSPEEKIIFGAYAQNNLIAYLILIPETGDVPQIAVDPKYRRQRVGSSLAAMALKHTELPLRFINIADQNNDSKGFFGQLGCLAMPVQYEMTLVL